MIDNENYSQIRKIFQDKFYKEIVPVLKKYENERKQKKGYLNWILLLSLILPIAISVGFGLDYEGTSSYILNIINAFLFSSIICFGIYFIILYQFQKVFERKVKDEIMPLFCSCFSNLSWTDFTIVDTNLLYSSNLILDSALVFHVDDVFEGKFKDVEFEVVELKIPSDNKLGFGGVLVKLDMNKRFNSNTIVYNKNSIKSQNMKFLNKLNKIKLEDGNFNNNFDTYSDDEVEARYHLTPAFIERINNMKTSFRATNISVSFYDKYLLLAFENTGDLFSVANLNKKVDDNRQYFQMFEEILSIIKLIDHFKLNEKTRI